MLTFLHRKADFAPLPLGPSAVLSGDRLEVTSGPLSGTTFSLSSAVEPHKADFFLLPAPPPPTFDPSSVVAHCHFDRDAGTGLETIWDIVVHPDYRGKGLAGLLVRTSFRTLLAAGKQHWFVMRKLMQVDSRRRELHNIGIGIIACRLGFRTEPDFAQMLGPGRLKSVELLPGTGASPPGLLLTLNRLPGVIVACGLEPDTGRPFADEEHYRRFASPAQITRLAQNGSWLIGNIDYWLQPAGIETLCRHLADSAKEYGAFHSSLRSGAKRLGLK